MSRHAMVNQRIEDLIEQYGFTVMYIFPTSEDSSPSFSYTVGLGEKGLPELIVFGLPQQAAHAVLNDAAQMLIEGNLPLKEPVSKLANLPVFFENVTAEKAEPYITLANKRAGVDQPAIQMIWPDRMGKFPWEADFDKTIINAQVLLFPSEPLKFRLH
jgi:hypothetical protein